MTINDGTPEKEHAITLEDAIDADFEKAKALCGKKDRLKIEIGSETFKALGEERETWLYFPLCDYWEVVGKFGYKFIVIKEVIEELK